MYVHVVEVSSSQLISTSPFGEGVSGATTLPTFSDSEALILIDIVFIRDKNKDDSELKEDIQIASIQFNNLDVVGKFICLFYREMVLFVIDNIFY